MSGISLVNHLISIERFVSAKFPTATTDKQTVPKKPVTNSFVIRLVSGSAESETAAHIRKDRDFQIVYFATEAAEVLATMDALSDEFYQHNVIPIKDSLRYIRAESFSFSQPFETDNKLFACIGILTTTVRESRDQETYDKIMHVHVRRN